MRVISQNWNIDIPYEKGCFVLTGSDNGECWDIFAYVGDRVFKMAQYSTKEQAQKVFISLHTRTGEYYIFPLDEKDQKEGDAVFVAAKGL